MIYAVIDLTTDVFQIANAGHPYPLCYRSKSKVLELWKIPSGPALGFIENQMYPVTKMPVAEGERVIFYTDGLTEAMNPDTEEFGEKRLMEVVRGHGTDAPLGIIEAVRRAIDLHRNGEKVSNDFSMLVTEIR